uniref:Uncharacterized protein n=1 Tax=Timema poppense TaxID=170557 RepID=A0A7R9HA27_TIMPO|nr:unnamed protein product [Timema poppensis]
MTEKKALYAPCLAVDGAGSCVAYVTLPLMSFDKMKPRLVDWVEKTDFFSRGSHYLFVQWQQCKWVPKSLELLSFSTKPCFSLFVSDAKKSSAICVGCFDFVSCVPLPVYCTETYQRSQSSQVGGADLGEGKMRGQLVYLEEVLRQILAAGLDPHLELSCGARRTLDAGQAQQRGRRSRGAGEEEENL